MAFDTSAVAFRTWLPSVETHVWVMVVDSPDASDGVETEPIEERLT